jgi:myo-inositol 2-dehydrogenase/D-chiro-inositol 1-dehydrogenase
LEEAMSDDKDGGTRREFLKTSALASAAIAASSLELPAVHAAGSDVLRIGLIGCGGRGTGAVSDALKADPGVKLVAIGDAFADRVAEARKNLESFGARIEVPPDRAFVGFDAYEKVLATNVDYVILATPPGFRPQHLKAAVAAGKHVFAEKPVAVDGPGIRTVLAVYEEANRKGLGIGVGTQRRHQPGYLETMQRVHDGAIGELVSARCFWNQGSLWNKPRQAQWSDTEWQLRNWLYFTWLSGDHIVEQHVHNLDVVNWAMRAHPVRALGIGGRQVRTGAEYGHIYDHFTIDYEYPNGAHLLSMCRQMPDCDNKVAEFVTGTKGAVETQSDGARYIITGPTPWRFKGDDGFPYQQEHKDLIASIRAGKPYNELKSVAETTLTAIMGRMSAYTGKAVTWDEALASEEQLVPTKLAFGPMPVPPVARPGQA